MAWWHRLFRAGSRKSEEIPEYVELWMRELIDEGMDPQAAREEALRSFGFGKDPEEDAGRPGGTIRRSA